MPGLFSLLHPSLPLDFLLSSKSSHSSFSASRFIVCWYVCPACVCVSELSLKCFNGEDDITVYNDHCSRLPLKAVFYTYSRHERAAPLAELNTSDMSSFFWDTSKFPQLSHHLWVLGSSTLPFKPSVARDTLKGENK